MNPQTYEYVDNQNQLRQIQANSPDEAIRLAPNRATTSGVSLYRPPQATQTQQPTQPETQNTQTLDSIYEGIIPNETEADRMAKRLYEQSQGLDTDQDSIRRDYINQFQDRINALNQVYDQQLAKAQQEGKGRVGSGTAILARRGLAGSPRGGAIQESILDQNRSIESAIDAQRNAEIGAIMGLASQMAVEESRARSQAKQEGAKSYLEFIKNQDVRKAEYVDKNVAALLSGGYDINEIDVDELAKKLGVSRQQIISQYQQGKAAQEAAQAEADFEREGVMLNRSKIQNDIELANKKFEEDKRQFGMDYALKARAQSLSELKASGGSSGPSVSSEYRQNSMNKVINFVDEALSQVRPGTAGFGSGVLSKVRGTDAKDLAGTLTTIKANIGFEALQAMREASKTGGALGQVAVQELEALQAVLGSIDQGQSPEQLRRNLTKIKGHYTRAIQTLQQANGQASSMGSSNIITAPDGQQIEIID